jgi:hypothetical protein
MRFVDACGGSLAAMAAQLAARAGVAATAHTTSAPSVDVELVRRTLEEIGVAGETGSVSSWEGVADHDTIHLAHDPPSLAAPLPGAEVLDAPFYVGPPETEFGPADLERIALMRLSRDRIERFLERRS